MNETEDERCRVYGEHARHAFALPGLGRSVGYFDCSYCGHWRAQQPDWLIEAHARQINDVIAGRMMRSRIKLGRANLGALLLEFCAILRFGAYNLVSKNSCSNGVGVIGMYATVFQSHVLEPLRLQLTLPPAAV